jgi:hypothetical protein
VPRNRVQEGVLAAALVVCLAASGCSPSTPVGVQERVAVADAEGSREAAPPTASETAGTPGESPIVTLFPSTPTSGDPVQAALRDKRTHAEKQASSWTWFINGKKARSDGSVLPAGEAKRGDDVWVEATAFSGGKGITLVSPRIRVVNSLPAVSDVSFNSLSPKKGDLLAVSARVTDSDGDPIRLRYKWVVNGQVVQEGGKGEYRLAEEKRGDQVHCEVYPDDGFSTGTWSATPVVDVQNSPPRFLKEPPAAAPDGTFSYRVSVEDVDGDPVKIEILQGPEGMVLDGDTVRWKPGAGFQGEAQVVLRATDGAGGDARQIFSLALPGK